MSRAPLPPAATPSGSSLQASSASGPSASLQPQRLGLEDEIDMSRLLGTPNPLKPNITMGQIARGNWNHYDVAGRNVAELDVTRTSGFEKAAIRETLTRQGFDLIPTQNIDRREYITIADGDAELLKKLQTDVYHTRTPEVTAPPRADIPAAPATATTEPHAPRQLTPTQRLFAHGEWQLQKGQDGASTAHLDTSHMKPHEISRVEYALRRNKIEFSADPENHALRLGGRDADMVMDLQKLHHPSLATPSGQPLSAGHEAAPVKEAPKPHHPSPMPQTPQMNPQLFNHGQWTSGQNEAGKPTATLDVENLPAHQKVRIINALRRENIPATFDTPGLKATTMTAEGPAAQKLLEGQTRQQTPKVPIAATLSKAAAVNTHIGRGQSVASAALKTAQGDYGAAATEVATAVTTEAAGSKKVQQAAGKAIVVAAATVAANESIWGGLAQKATKALKFAKRIPGVGVVATVAAGVVAVGMYLSRGEFAKAGVETVASVAEAGANILPTGGLSGDGAREAVRGTALALGGKSLEVDKSQTRQLAEGAYALSTTPKRPFNVAAAAPMGAEAQLVVMRPGAAPTRHLTLND